MRSMSRRRFLGLAIGAGGAAAGGLAAWSRWGGSGGEPTALGAAHGGGNEPGANEGGAAAGLVAARRSAWAFGAQVSVTVLHERRQTAEDAASAALAELGYVEQACSLYRPDSALSRLNRDGELSDAPAALLEALAAASRMSERSAGAFDATVQPLWTIWADSDRLGGRPDDSAIDSARGLVGWQDVAVASGRVRLARPGMAVTLNGVAQGLAADRVLAVLQQREIRHALVNTGEVGTIGRKEDDQPWKAGIQHPRHPDAFMRVAELDGRCMSTSGDYATRFGSGFGDHHIFDPATGRSPGELSAVTVLAPRAVDADALSTAVFVMGARRGLDLVRSWPGADALLVDKAGHTTLTDGFPVA